MTQKNAEAPLLISQKASKQFSRVNVQELEATYPLVSDLTPALMSFLADAEKSKAKYVSHLTLVTYEGARSCVIMIGSEEDLKTMSTRDQPMDAPRRINTDVINAQEKIHESKAFCKVAGTGAKRDFVMIQARIYVPQEGANQNNAID